MELIFHDTKTYLLEALNILFIKWWKAGVGLFGVWFADNILLFITPGEVEGWVKLLLTVLIGGITATYMFKKKSQSQRHEEEKHRQELAQDKMNGWIEQYERARTAKIISEQTTLADFIKQIELIEAANASQNTHK